ncbi:MAG TPA: hypothetical protein VG308_09165 [Stellaceae bacterium]|jgi:hypothetical protein|nr:hypothetical protein [Stellaceae bacterium]
MTKDVQLGWIAEAEARRFAESARTQHGAAEPQAGVVFAEPGAAPRHWVRRLVARFVPPPGEDGAAGDSDAPKT